MNATFIHGIAVGLGVEIEKAGNSLLITTKDLDRIRQALRRRERGSRPVVPCESRAPTT